MPGGRPTDYSLKLADAICERLSCGESMRSVCRDDAMPAISTVFRWFREKPGFREQYDVAKEESADALADDIIDIADNEVSEALVIDDKPILDSKGDPILIKTAVGVAHAKLRVDARKWAASKLKPKKYGDKLQTETKHTFDLSGLTTEELNAIAAGQPITN